MSEASSRRSRVPSSTIREPGQFQIDNQIDAASINTREAQRDTHLKSADFLDVEKFPYITFKSKSLKPHDDGWRMAGDLETTASSGSRSRR